MEYDVHDQHDELQLLLDVDSHLEAIPIHLGPWTLTEALNRFIAAADKLAPQRGIASAMPPGFSDRFAESISRRKATHLASGG